jgi:hypothetical protein
VHGMNVSCMENAVYDSMVQSIWAHERLHVMLAFAEAANGGNDLWDLVEPLVHTDELKLHIGVFDRANDVNGRIVQASGNADEGERGPYYMIRYDTLAPPGTWDAFNIKLQGGTWP